MAIFFILLLLGIKVNFILKDELNIGLTPLDAGFTIPNDGSANVEFKIKNNNFAECDARCEFVLRDLQTNRVISSENNTLEHEEELTKSYVLSPKKKGEGQVLYNFEVKCNNIRSIICFTKEESRYKSAIIAINYVLTEEESKLKPELKIDLEEYSNYVSESITLAEQNYILLNQLNLNTLEEKDLQTEAAAISLGSSTNQWEELVSLWNEEEYLPLKKILSEIEKNDSLEIKNRLSGLQESIINVRTLRNQDISLLEEAKASDLITIIEHYQNNNWSTLEIETIASDIYESYIIIADEKGVIEKTFNENLKNNAERLKERIKEFEYTKTKGLFLLIFGQEQLHIKNEPLAESNFSKFGCDELRTILSDIDRENIESVAYREDNYKWSLRDKDFEDELREAERMMELEALQETRKRALGLPEEDVLLGIINEEIAVKNYSSEIRLKIEKSELYKMALLNNTDNQESLNNNCKDSSENFTLPLAVSKLLSMNLSHGNFEKRTFDLPAVGLPAITAMHENLPTCCIYNICKPCCKEECKDDEKLYPVLFIHGHSFNEANTPEFSMNSFTKIQRQLQNDDYLNGGELDFRTSIEEKRSGEWGRSGRPVTVRASYYYILHYDLKGLTVTAQKSERIENYAIRLKEIIDSVKQRTGHEKVNIIAHSMGGLVTREYLNLFGYEDINKVITINTPHHGITGRVKKFCSVIGSSKECNDMSSDSIFISRLNAKKQPKYARIYAIRSIGCIMEENLIGDGIVTNESAYWEDAQNYVLNGKCTDSLETDLHSNVLDPELYPQTYSLINKILTVS